MPPISVRWAAGPRVAFERRGVENHGRHELVLGLVDPKIIRDFALDMPNCEITSE